MAAEAPQRLFKYQGFSTRLIGRLCNSQAYYADPSSFNDPLDCRPIVEPDLSVDELKSILGSLVSRRVEKEVVAALKKLKFRSETIMERKDRQAQRVLSSMLQDIKYDASNEEAVDPELRMKLAIAYAIETELRNAFDQGVLCLSTRYSSPLMWSHYADQHRGVCIEYDVSELKPAHILEVNYGESRELKASAIQQWLLEPMDTAARQAVEKACLLTKSTEWGYEEEYRIFGRQGDHSSPAPIKSVTFGLRCDPVVQYSIVASLKGKDSPYEFFVIKPPGTRFELSRGELDLDAVLQGMPNTTGRWDFEDVAQEPPK